MNKKPEIAAQLYTVREFTKTEEDIAKTLKKIKEIGYDSVQVSAFGPYRTEFLRDALAENALTACATHTPYERIVGETEKVIAEHKILGIPYIGLGYRRLGSLAATETFLKELLPAAEKIADGGLKFVYHNHHWEFVRLENGQTVMEYFLEHTSPEIFGLLPDCYWLQVSGINPERFLVENKDRIGVIHLKDMRIAKEDGAQRYAEIFEGNMDYISVYAAAERAGVKYAAVEQDECYGRDSFESLKISRENIRARLGV